MTINQITAILKKYATVPNQSGTKLFIPAEKATEISREIMLLTKSKFTPPTLDEVKAFFKEKGYEESAAIKAWEYYEDGDWKDSSGKQVLSWKQKIRVVWFRDEFKIVDKSQETNNNKMVY